MKHLGRSVRDILTAHLVEQAVEGQNAKRGIIHEERPQRVDLIPRIFGFEYPFRWQLKRIMDVVKMYERQV